ncbi:ubiquitin-binding SDF ubiquitin ligase complex subunit [Saccharomycopsis crataegensis]|uniref:Ubiquitin-binding SDF ubiquitin ligase complex subunit n=1 Tax=Saccharomycopsis crataegensis TaxID=43959 RepID=A0AAV5QM94_9ASCO|nr:ubiquitin-binding SDF ubiquitin ligase complex subunit [Saccharomycopsis crataegensis]
MKQDDDDDLVRPFLTKHIPVANNTQRLNGPAIHSYCYRHNPDIKCNKDADQQRMCSIQTSIDKLPSSDQKAISNVWSVFSAAPNSQRILILQGILSQCCFHQLSFLSSEVKELVKIDFIGTLPVELSLKILCYLDCASLCNAAQVSRTWKRLADDDRVWHHLCKQHIDRKCPNCGWGLPLLYMKRARSGKYSSKNHKDDKMKITPVKEEEKGVGEEEEEEEEEEEDHQAKITPVGTDAPVITNVPSDICSSSSKLPSLKRPAPNSSKDLIKPPVAKRPRTRPWKSVYSERYKVERNWRKGIFKIKRFEGHSDGILCLQFNHKILITGSYDCTVKVWDLKTCKVIRTLVGHTRGVKTLVFDDKKVITGSLDGTIMVWNLATGTSLSTYRGHSDGIMSVDMLGKTIVSGSADKTIKIWNVETRTCHTLRGHTDWVNSVKIHGPSKTIISASDDCTIRIWSLENNSCLKVFSGPNGHIGQVQCALPLTIHDTIVEDENSDEETESPENRAAHNDTPRTNNVVASTAIASVENSSNLVNSQINGALPSHILSCGLDNQIKLWDVNSGRCIRTQFGHVEGVWSVSADTFRIVSGSHDKLVKVWDLQSGKCIHTFGGQHKASVSCVKLTDSRFAAGDESGMVKMYCFDDLEDDEVWMGNEPQS